MRQPPDVRTAPRGARRRRNLVSETPVKTSKAYLHRLATQRKRSRSTSMWTSASTIVPHNMRPAVKRAFPSDGNHHDTTPTRPL